MTEEAAQPPVVHNAAARRFEIVIDGRTAFSRYLLAGNKQDPLER